MSRLVLSVVTWAFWVIDTFADDPLQATHIQILNATDRQAIDSQMTGAIVKREDGPLAEPPAALDL